MGNALWACYDDMIDFRATGGRDQGIYCRDHAAIMRDRYNRWVVLFLFACPEGEVGRGTKDERRERGWGVAAGGSH